MPSTSPKLLKKWGGADGVGEDKALNFLLERGWTEIGNGMMKPPPVKTADFQAQTEEWEALQFLVEEWDFGLWTDDCEADDTLGV